MFKRGLQTRIAIMFACQLAFVLFGYDQGVFSGIVGNQAFRETMGCKYSTSSFSIPLIHGQDPNDSLTGIIVSTYNLGCFTGCILNFFVGNWLGRRRAMWFAMIWIIVRCSVAHVNNSPGEIEEQLRAIDRCCAPDFRLQRSSSHNRSVRYGYRHWHRDIDCAYVPSRALRSAQPRETRVLGATLRRRRDRDRLLFRLWHVVRGIATRNSVAPAHFLSDDIRLHRRLSCIWTTRESEVLLSERSKRRGTADSMRRLRQRT